MNIRTMTSSKTPSVADDSATKKHLRDRRCNLMAAYTVHPF